MKSVSQISNIFSLSSEKVYPLHLSYGQINPAFPSVIRTVIQYLFISLLLTFCYSLSLHFHPTLSSLLGTSSALEALMVSTWRRACLGACTRESYVGCRCLISQGVLYSVPKLCWSGSVEICTVLKQHLLHFAWAIKQVGGSNNNEYKLAVSRGMYGKLALKSADENETQIQFFRIENNSNQKPHSRFYCKFSFHNGQFSWYFAIRNFFTCDVHMNLVTSVFACVYLRSTSCCVYYASKDKAVLK